MAKKQNTLTPRAPRNLDIAVDAEIREFFTSADIRGHGGFQSLLRSIAERLRHSSILRVEKAEFERIVRYGTQYGDGGYQQRLRSIVAQWVGQNFDSLI